MSPCVVSAMKFGASELIRRDMVLLLIIRSQSLLELVQWNLEIALAVVLGRRELACSHVDLHRRQDKLRHAEFGVAPRAHAYKLVRAHPVMDMHVVRTLGRDHGFPAEFVAPRRLVVVAEKQAGCAGER